ncbi:hypothetical protein L2E82_48197 [Cichorium intybus]|uniref:Uncharacterized protein n=1 Tax=Cichorium intybus TaxID=13427 RepID=A0ACB8YYP7_CICIN|nr:hypothetical protein L1887_27597 [Cichorium endivia]KAI3690221.1 hypothetical protein L2E82_48197 [Cichorium intybus]
MATMLSSDLMHPGMHEGGPHKQSDNTMEENGGRWYFSRKEIEENSPSRSDGIDLKKETYLRKSYCTFLQDLGMRLQVPQVTIATAIIFCHRFFLRQSHAKNDRRTVATVCMFLAGKVEETPRPLKDVILVSYEINHKKDPNAIQRIKQKEVYEQQKEIILIGERVVLATLAFDFNVHHPYKPLVEAIKKFKVAQNAENALAQKALAQVAWNFVNDGLRTSLCLQFKPHHIAAGAIFLAAKFLKVKLPSDGDKVWWQEFNVTPRQLEEVSNQMLELYEQNRVPPSQTSEVLDGSTGGGGVTPKAHEEHNTNDSNSHVGPATSDHQKTSRDQSNDDGSTDRNKEIDSEVENNDDRNHESGQNPECRFRSPKEAVKKIDKDKVRAAFEKRRKERGGDVNRKTELMDDDDLIERELEDGIELGGESEKRKRNWCNEVEEVEAVEEGEVGLLDDVDGGDRRHRVVESGRKRKGGGSPPPPDKRRRN